MKLRVLVVLCFAVLTSSLLHAADWGTLTGQFVYDGEAPERKPLNIVRAAICAKDPPLEEDLIVHPKNRGLANVVVTLRLKKGQKLGELHESYQKTEKAKVRVTNKNCRFEPRVTLLRTTQTLVLGNDDPIPHNSLGYVLFNAPFNDTIPANDNVERRLPKIERRPVQVKCTIHAWMKGWLVVHDNPYMAVSDEDGKFEIKNLPEGEWTFQFWHESAGYLSKIDLDGTEVEDKKGLYTLPIAAEDVELGEIRLNADLF